MRHWLCQRRRPPAGQGSVAYALHFSKETGNCGALFRNFGDIPYLPPRKLRAPSLKIRATAKYEQQREKAAPSSVPHPRAALPRQRSQSGVPHIHRHSGASRNPGIPHIYRHPQHLPSSYLPSSPISTVIPHIYRHSGESRNPGVSLSAVIPQHLPSSPISTVIPAKAGIPAFPIRRHPLYPPSSPISTVIPHIYRHSGESRNLAPPPYSTLPRNNGPPAKPPEKSAIFNDTTPLPTVHQCGTLAISKSGNPASGSNVPPKANPRRRCTRRPNPTGQRLSPKAKSIGRKIGQPSRNRVQDNTAKPSVLQPSSDPARTPPHSPGVCQATPRAFPPLYAGPAMGRGMEN